jgi:hypothetical protein
MESYNKIKKMGHLPSITSLRAERDLVNKDVEEAMPEGISDSEHAQIISFAETNHPHPNRNDGPLPRDEDYHI